MRNGPLKVADPWVERFVAVLDTLPPSGRKRALRSWGKSLLLGGVVLGWWLGSIAGFLVGVTGAAYGWW